jgi:sec-independent protein translocase protein TatA
MNPLFAFFEGMMSPTHIILVLVVGIVLFGKRLPEVGKSLGKTLMEFKKGMKGLEDDTDVSSAPPPAPRVSAPQRLDVDPRPKA